MNSDKQIQIAKEILFLKTFLEKHSRTSPDSNFTSSFLDLLIMLLADDKQEDFQVWLAIAKQYFSEYKPNEHTLEYDIILLEFYKYLLSVIEGKPNFDLAKKHCDLHFDYIQKNYKLNKSNLVPFEEVVMSLLEIKEFDRAYELCKKIQSVKERHVLSLVMKYSFEKEDGTQDNLRKKYRTDLKKREGVAYVLSYFYFSYYYREMLKIDSAKEIFKGMVFGLD